MNRKIQVTTTNIGRFLQIRHLKNCNQNSNNHMKKANLSSLVITVFYCTIRFSNLSNGLS